MTINLTSAHFSSIQTVQEIFLEKYPTFKNTLHLDELRALEYARLDRKQHVYLDYTGGGLYAESQLRQHMELLHDNIFGNPHSTNPTSLAMTTLVEGARAAVLAYFNASPDEYVAIFTPNATGALKLVGEAYPFAPGGQYLLTFDNHNSVNGIREFARTKGATFTYVPLMQSDLRVNEPQLMQYLDRARPGKSNLFAYPAQSNVSGVQHPLEWIALAQARGWDVLVDCAAFTPTNRLDLSRWHPDFVPLSFYKIFGYPTGVGCLLVRKAALAKLSRPWYAGGTVVLTSVVAARSAGEGFYLKPDQEGFEDGTVSYLLLPAVEFGLKHIERIGIDLIHERVRCLTGWLLESLQALRHSNGRPVVHIYGPTTTQKRGGTIAFNFYDPAGKQIDCYTMQEEANSWNISLRSGCFCNPGVREVALNFAGEEMMACFQDKEWVDYEQFLRSINGRPTQGALRISVGLVTNFADVYRFLQFVQSFVDRSMPHTHAHTQEDQFLLQNALIGRYGHDTDQLASTRQLAQRNAALHIGWYEQPEATYPDTASLLNNTAALYYAEGKYSEAEPLYQRALALCEQQLGPTHPDTAKSLNNLGLLYKNQGRYSEAEALYRRALTIYEQQLGPTHLDTASSLNNLALLHKSQRKYSQAEPLYKRALAIYEQQLGPAHPHTANSLNNLADFYHEQGKNKDAEPLFLQALAIREQTLGPEHPDTAHSVWWLAFIYQQQQQYQQAEPLYKRALAIYERILGPEHPHTQHIQQGYASLLRNIGRNEEATRLTLHSKRA